MWKLDELNFRQAGEEIATGSPIHPGAYYVMECAILGRMCKSGRSIILQVSWEGDKGDFRLKRTYLSSSMAGSNLKKETYTLIRR